MFLTVFSSNAIVFAMDNCIFCKIANSSQEFIYSDDKIVVFKDIHPQADTHLLFVPKKHMINMLDLERDSIAISQHIIECMSIVAKQLGLSGFKTVVNTGKDAGQVVMHLHFHLLSGNIRRV